MPLRARWRCFVLAFVGFFLQKTNTMIRALQARKALWTAGLVFPACTLNTHHLPQPSGGVVVYDVRLQAALTYLSEHSASFRSVLQRIEKDEGYVMTIERQYADEAIAQVGAQVLPPISGRGARVVVYTEVLEDKALEQGYALGDLTLDLALILGHEIYAHIVPAFEQGVDILSNPCPDPGPMQYAMYSCALKRDNQLRRELGLEPRLDYTSRDIGFVRCALLNDCRTSRR